MLYTAGKITLWIILIIPFALACIYFVNSILDELMSIRKSEVEKKRSEEAERRRYEDFLRNYEEKRRGGR